MSNDTPECTGPFSDARDCPVHRPVADAAPRPAPSAGEIGHPLEKLAEWFEAVNQKITDTSDGHQPPSYAELWEDIQHGLRHVGYLLTLADPPVAPASPETPRWLPMESAPKDGRTVLLYDPNATGEGEDSVSSGYFHEGVDCWIWSADGCEAHPTLWYQIPDPPAASPRPRPEEPTR